MKEDVFRSSEDPLNTSLTLREDNPSPRPSYNARLTTQIKEMEDLLETANQEVAFERTKVKDLERTGRTVRQQTDIDEASSTPCSKFDQIGNEYTDCAVDLVHDTHDGLQTQRAELQFLKEYWSAKMGELSHAILEAQNEKRQ
jgi:hypothetical protein